jgi:hypothetical protein
MTLEKFREAWKAAPFRPFNIHTADGRSFPVVHPEFVMRSPSGRTIAVEYGNDRSAFVDLLLVTSIEFTPPSAASA